jgi:hypothetical protein
MGADTRLGLGRQAHRRQVWRQAFALLSEVDAGSPLAADDLDLVTEAASMLGRGEDEVRLLRRAFAAHADAGRIGSALRCGYWLCKALAWAGEFAQAGVWLTRAQRLAETQPDCRERGYLLMLDAERHFRAGEHAEMLAVAHRLAEVAGQGADRDLAPGAAMALGNALIMTGAIESGPCGPVGCHYSVKPMTWHSVFHLDQHT